MSLQIGLTADNNKILSRYIFPGCCGIDVIRGFPRTKASWSEGFSDKQKEEVEEALTNILNGSDADYYHSDEEMYGGTGFFKIGHDTVLLIILADFQIDAFEPMILKAGFEHFVGFSNTRMSSQCQMYLKNKERISSISNLIAEPVPKKAKK